MRRATDLVLAVTAALIVLYLVAANAPRLFGGLLRSPLTALLERSGYSAAELAQLDDGQLAELAARKYGGTVGALALLVGGPLVASRILAPWLVGASAALRLTAAGAVLTALYLVARQTGALDVAREWAGIGEPEPCARFGGAAYELGMAGGGYRLVACKQSPWVWEPGRGHYPEAPVPAD